MACSPFYGRATEGAEQEFTENKTSKWLKPDAFDSVVFPKVQMKLVDQLEKIETIGILSRQSSFLLI